MPNFYKKGDVKVEFRVVRAYITSEQVRKQTGIVANFSAKTIVHTGKGLEFVVMSHNALTLTVSRENHLYVGSDFEQHLVTRQGKQTMSPKVFYFSLMPGSDRSETSLENYDNFVGDLANEIRDFVVKMRGQQEENANAPARPLPEAAKGLEDLAPKPRGAAEASRNDADIPF
tara:strand:- start:32631 stop:33149 length:519 start_codon:yes stop_codon:yes gene_type:complete